MRWLSSGRKIKESLTDEALIAGYKLNADPEAITIIYDRYIHLVYGVCLKYLKDREEAQDATMQLFEKLIQLLKDHEIQNFRSWLYSTARNHCLMHIRKKGGTHKIDGALFMELADEIHPIDDPDEETEVRLQHCIDNLREQQKICIELFYLKNNNYDQITVVTGYDLRKVKSYLQNGRRNLKMCMEKNEEKVQR